MQEHMNNLCGFYVCEFTRQTCYEKGRILEQLNVHKQYSQFYFITISYVEFHSYILTSFFTLDQADAGWSSSNRACTGNSRGIGGILTWRGHSTSQRIPSAIQFWTIVIEIILYICMNMYGVPLCNMFDQARWKMTLASIPICMTMLCNIMVSCMCASICFKYPQENVFEMASPGRLMRHGVYINHRPVGNPKRMVW
jgi:hypothetical protein